MENFSVRTMKVVGIKLNAHPVHLKTFKDCFFHKILDSRSPVRNCGNNLMK